MNFYVLKDFTLDGRTYASGRIVTVEDFDGESIEAKREKVEHLRKTGALEEANVPELSQYSTQVKMALDKARKKKENLKHDKRYDDAESMRAYEIEQVELELEDEISSIKEQYEEKVKEIEADLLGKMSAVASVSADDQTKAAAIVSEVNFGDGVGALLEQLPYLSDGVKSALMAKVPEMDIDNDDKKAVYKELRDGQQSIAEARRKMKHVKAYKETFDPLALYRVYKAVKKAGRR